VYRAYQLQRGNEIYPEEIRRNQDLVLENDRPLPKHLLYPRTKVQQLRKARHVKAVDDITISYGHNDKFLEAPTIWESLSCGGLSKHRGYRFHVDVKRILVEDLPQTDAELAKWLEKRWIAKGEFLEAKAGGVV